MCQVITGLLSGVNSQKTRCVHECSLLRNLNSFSRISKVIVLYDTNKSSNAPTFLAAAIRRLTTTISVIMSTLVTAANSALAARMIFALSVSAESPWSLIGISVKLDIIEAAAFASIQASPISAANSAFSHAISSPILTKCRIASFSFAQISCSVLRARADRLGLAFLWLISVVICKKQKLFWYRSFHGVFKWSNPYKPSDGDKF